MTSNEFHNPINKKKKKNYKQKDPILVWVAEELSDNDNAGYCCVMSNCI